MAEATGQGGGIIRYTGIGLTVDRFVAAVVGDAFVLAPLWTVGTKQQWHFERVT